MNACSPKIYSACNIFRKKKLIMLWDSCSVELVSCSVELALLFVEPVSCFVEPASFFVEPVSFSVDMAS